MKLRQKLAAVLAATMIVTAVPVVTMAASTNKLSQTATLVEGSTVGYTANAGNLTDGTTASAVYTVTNTNVQLMVEGDQAGSAEFYINAVDGEFEKAAYYAWANNLSVYKNAADGKFYDAAGTAINLDAANANYTKTVSGTAGATNEITVEWLSATQLKVNAGSDVAKNFSVPFLIKAKKGTPAIAIDGDDSRVSSSTLAISTGEVVGKQKLVATAGTVKNINIDGEGTLGDIVIAEKAPAALNGAKVFEIKLPAKSELVFADAQAIKTVGTRGLAGKITEAVPTANVEILDDNKTIKVTIPTTAASTTWGEVKIQGISVVAEDTRKEVKAQDIKVTVENTTKDIMEKATLIVAKVADFGAAMTTKEEDKVEMVAGQDVKDVKVTLTENVAGSITNGRKIYFTLENAYFVDANGIALKDQEMAITPNFKDGEMTQKFSIKSAAGVDGDVVLKAESRDFDGVLETVVGTVESGFTVETTPFVVETGVKGQKGGKVVITETKEERFAKGDVFEITTELNNIKDAKVVAEDMEVKYEVKGNKIIITVVRPSEEAGVITVSDLELDVDGAAPKGHYELYVAGDAITTFEQYTGKTSNGVALTEADKLVVEKFIQVGTGIQGKTEVVVNIKTGEATKNGETMELLATPFASKAGRTMVGARDIATFFGIAEGNILFSNGTVTIINGENIIQLSNDSNILRRNGQEIIMDEKMTIVDGRSFVPARYLAIALNINVDFQGDNAVFTTK